MNFGDLQIKAKLLMPLATPEKISNVELKKILNEGALDIASNLNLLHKNVKFDVEEDTYEYTISTIASDFLRIDSSGLYWNRGTESSSDWGDPLDAYTKEKLDAEFINWRSDSAGSPERYFIESNSLFIHPTPDTDLTEGFWLYYIAKPEIMSDNSHYPFVTSVEVPQYTILHETILFYWKWKASEMIPDLINEVNNNKLKYETMLLSNKEIFERRIDLENIKRFMASPKLLRGQTIR